jgi:hypothetical protein
VTRARIDEEETVKRTWGLVAVTLSGACVVAACGGGAAEAPAGAATPATKGEPTPGYPPSAPYGTTNVSPAGTDETTSPRPQNGSVQPRPPVTVDTYRVNARDELARAESELAAAQKDCASACRALASMERAAKSLCDLGGADECLQARARVEAARDRVRSSCGSCPNTR